MGQKIEVVATSVIGAVAVFDTDRSLSGQDGERYRSAEAAADGTTFPAELAGRLFELSGISSVYVTSNVVSVERDGGWSEDDLTAVSQVISDFFLFYVPSV